MYVSTKCDFKTSSLISVNRMDEIEYKLLNFLVLHWISRDINNIKYTTNNNLKIT